MPKKGDVNDSGANDGGIDDVRDRLARGEDPSKVDPPKGPDKQKKKDDNDQSDGPDDDGPEDDGADDDDSAEGDDSDKDVEELKAEVAKMRKALAKANRDAQRNRDKANKAPDQATVDTLRQEMNLRDAADQLRDEHGLKGNAKAARRAARMLDSIEPDEVEDAIEQLKEDYPELFTSDDEKRPRRTKRAPKTGPAGGDQRQSPPSDSGSALSSTSKRMLRMARSS